MIDNTGMYQNYSVEGEIKLKGDDNMMSCEMSNMCPPIYECPKERCIHREIIHNVPHVVPINTRIINHHIYRHTYRPCYTCTEENEVCNVNECFNTNFM